MKRALELLRTTQTIERRSFQWRCSSFGTVRACLEAEVVLAGYPDGGHGAEYLHRDTPERALEPRAVLSCLGTRP